MANIPNANRYRSRNPSVAVGHPRGRNTRDRDPAMDASGVAGFLGMCVGAVIGLFAWSLTSSLFVGVLAGVVTAAIVTNLAS